MFALITLHGGLGETALTARLLELLDELRTVCPQRFPDRPQRGITTRECLLFTWSVKRRQSRGTSHQATRKETMLMSRKSLVCATIVPSSLKKNESLSTWRGRWKTFAWDAPAYNNRTQIAASCCSCLLLWTDGNFAKWPNLG